MFARRSTVWGGGLAFYDPATEGSLAARAYLVTFGQFSDVVAQEAVSQSAGTWSSAGSSGGGQLIRVYGTLVHVDDHEGFPSCDLVPAGPRAHTPIGSLSSHHPRGPRRGVRLDPDERIDYLMRARGVTPAWTRDALNSLC